MWDDWDLDGLLTEVPCAYAAKLGVRYGIFCSTGTAGLHASLMALELLPGDEVIVPCMTFIRAITPLVHLGLVPVLADIDPVTGNLDPAALEAEITSRTRAVIVVHMWGVPADMDRIQAVCRKYQLLLIEDFSHAHYSRHTRGAAGSFGDVAFASFQKKKVLSVGEGGIIVTDDARIYARLQQITSPGSFQNTPNYAEFSGFGLNMRMSPFAAVVAKALLDEVDQIVASRALHAQTFTELLSAASPQIAAPEYPNYAMQVSAYGYKPALAPGTPLSSLSALNTRGRWAFSTFNYDHILASPFWRKSRAHFPFALQIAPRARPQYLGYEAYSTGRISVGVPTIDATSYWDVAQRALWAGDLREALTRTL